jgi:hypothetical protein
MNKLRTEWIENKKLIECKCGIEFKYICKCDNPKYELVKINRQLWCIPCDKWKCRCKKRIDIY